MDNKNDERSNLLHIHRDPAEDRFITLVATDALSLHWARIGSEVFPEFGGCSFMKAVKSTSKEISLEKAECGFYHKWQSVISQEGDMLKGLRFDSSIDLSVSHYRIGRKGVCVDISRLNALKGREWNALARRMGNGVSTCLLGDANPLPGIDTHALIINVRCQIEFDQEDGDAAEGDDVF